MSRPPRRSGRPKSAPVTPAAPVTVVVDRLGVQGDGIASHDGAPLFIPFVLPGETVEVVPMETRGEGRAATLKTVVKASPDRISPACRHFGSCGGCALQHMSDRLYTRFKRDRIETAFDHRGLDKSVLVPVVAGRPGERRRAVLSAVLVSSGVILGFNRRASHQLVDLGECPVLAPEITRLIAPLRGLLAALLPVRSSVDLVITASDTGIDLTLRAPGGLDLAKREALAGFAEDHDLARLVWHETGGEAEPVAVRRKPRMAFAGTYVPLPAGGFLQATKSGEAAIVAAVLEGLHDSGEIADLYAGLGTLTLPLAATGAKVFAVEGDRAAAEALANVTGGTRITVERRDLDRLPLRPEESSRFGTVVLDPPRAGARAQAEMLAASTVPAVIYVSCAAESFARDAAILVSGGYDLRKLTPVDQFLWSPHIEMVGVFRR